MASNRTAVLIDSKAAQKRLDEACQKKTLGDKYSFLWYPEQNVAIISGFKNKYGKTYIKEILRRKKGTISEARAKKIAECAALSITTTSFQEKLNDLWVVVI